MCKCPKNIENMSEKGKGSHGPCFQLFHGKPPVVMAIIGLKTPMLSKKSVYCWPKKSKGCPFFMIFHEKITTVSLIFCRKNVDSLKNT